MYEETKSSIDWKGLFLKAIIVFLIILIAVTGYKTLTSKNTKTENNQNNTQKITDSKNSSTFTSNMEKLRTSGKNYFEKNKDKLPTKKGSTTIVTLNELINEGYITELLDEEEKKCDGESSYVTATLDGNNTKIKANLVCGNASTYSTVYLNNNTSVETDSTNKTTSSNSSSTSTSNKTSSTNSSSNSSSTTNKTTSTNSSTTSSTNKTTTCTTNCVPSVTVNTNVSQNVTINDKVDQEKVEVKKVFYTVEFDSNGGNTMYRSQTVEENKTAYNPGNNRKSGCTFRGWYYNGSKYDFKTPVTKDITLKAYYICENEEEIEEYEYTSYVYTIGWDAKGTDSINITHTLKLPEELEELDIKKARIAKINYGGPINTRTLVNKYNKNHEDTFMYVDNGWEANDKNNASYLATITEDAVLFSYSPNYKTIGNALNHGFEVTWKANYIEEQCSRTFTVNNVSNLCNYGIYYIVTWEYQLYE